MMISRRHSRNRIAPTLAALIAGVWLLAISGADAWAQAQSADQQSCSTVIDKTYGKSVKAIGKDVGTCLKTIAKGQASATCFGKDTKGKIAKATAASEQAHADSCTGVQPDFGFAGAGVANDAALQSDDQILAILFGEDLAAALTPGNPDKAFNKCQQGVAKALQKCRDTRVKEYAKCKKRALKDGATAQAAVTTCVTQDAKGKIAKTCDLNDGSKVDKIRKAVAKKCAGVDLSLALPGCGTADAEALHACAEPQEACSACAAIARVAGAALEADCDAYDNDASDNSCLAIAFENVTLPSTAEPAETPGTSGVVVTNPKLIEQFGSSSFNLNNALYTRWRLGGPEQQPDAIFIMIAGFGGDTNNWVIMVEDLIPKIYRDHGLVIEMWGYHRRANQLEDRVGELAAIAAGNEEAALDWYFGDDMGLTLDPLLAAGPNRRAVFYNSSDDIPFLANWTGAVLTRDVDVIVEQARATAKNANVFMGGHSAGTGFTARYASTDFNTTGVGPAEPGYVKLRGIAMFEGGGGSTAGDPLTSDSLDRMIAKADGGLFGAVRDNAPRCVDGTTTCTIATEAADCLGQVPPVCTEPQPAYSAISGLGVELTATSGPAAIQAVTDPDGGLNIVQQDFTGPNTSAVDLVPGLAVLGILQDSTATSLIGQFLDDDEIGASLSTSTATGLGISGGGNPKVWIDITEGPIPPAATPDNGPAPTTPPPGIFGGEVWGQEKELVRMDRFVKTFIAADSNAADWYYEASGVLSAPGRCPAGTCTVGNVGASCSSDSECAQSISLDSTALSATRPDIVNLTQAASVDIPVISFGGSNGLTPVGANYLPFAQSIGTCTAPSCDGTTARVVDASLPNEAFPTYGNIAGGYEVYISEGLAHNDVLTSEDGPDAGILDPLAAFIARNVQ